MMNKNARELKIVSVVDAAEQCVLMLIDSVSTVRLRRLD
jgi:hypothetical protein